MGRERGGKRELEGGRKWRDWGKKGRVKGEREREKDNTCCVTVSRTGVFGGLRKIIWSLLEKWGTVVIFLGGVLRAGGCLSPFSLPFSPFSDPSPFSPLPHFLPLSLSSFLLADFLPIPRPTFSLFPGRISPYSPFSLFSSSISAFLPSSSLFSHPALAPKSFRETGIC